jgi:hypothetical protein
MLQAKIPPINEIILWNNCTNHCMFCLQNIKNDPLCHLLEDEKIEALERAYEKISGLTFSDVLLIGGEICNYTTDRTASKLLSLILLCRQKVEAGELRFVYLNTNLLYADQKILYAICSLFEDYEDHLRLTTSYDIEGRFSSKDKEKLFFDNIKALTSRFPKQPVVINTIMTKALCESDFSTENLVKLTNARSVVLIPFLSSKDCSNLEATKEEVFNTLEKAEQLRPGYIRKTIESLDLKQERYLWEYHKDVKDLVECEAPNSSCGHNKNFSRIFNDGECYVCELKRKFANSLE